MAAHPTLMLLAGHFTIPSDHPALPGHFPGQPIVPGVVVLDHALALLQAAEPACVPSMIRHAKFFTPVLPGETIEVRFQAGGTAIYTMQCLRGGQAVLSCTFGTAGSAA